MNLIGPKKKVIMTSSNVDKSRKMEGNFQWSFLPKFISEFRQVLRIPKLIESTIDLCDSSNERVFHKMKWATYFSHYR